MKQNAGHRGFHEFRICNADGIDNPQNDCFEGSVLQSIDGRVRFWQHPPSEGLPDDRVWVWNDVFDESGLGPIRERSLLYSMVLPTNLTCQHCIFQVMN